MYATLQEIRDNCANIANVANGTDEQITMWGTEAFVRINLWCGMDFTFEDQVTKTTYGSYHPTIHLPKVVSGDVAVMVTPPGGTPEVVPDTDLEIEPNTYSFRYLPLNTAYPQTGQIKFEITADWGYETLPTEIKIAFYKITGRIALRDNEDDLRYHNSGFTSESWGDGYSYNISNAELRSLIHPNDVVLLWKHQHHGRVVS